MVTGDVKPVQLIFIEKIMNLFTVGYKATPKDQT